MIADREAEFGSRVVLGDIFNAGSSVLKVYRIFMLNSNWFSTTGQQGNLNISRTSAVFDRAACATRAPYSLPTMPINAAKQARLPTGISCWYNRAVTATDLFRNFIWNSDDVGTINVRTQTWEMTLEVGEVWEAGAVDAAVQPLTFRSGYGIAIVDVANSYTAGQVDLFFETTTE